MQLITFISVFLFLSLLLSFFMILFIVFYQRFLKRKQLRSSRESKLWIDFFDTQVLGDQAISEENLNKYIYKRLRHIDEMVVFVSVIYEYLNSDQPEHSQAIENFTQQIYPSWLKLGKYYLRKNNMQKAYFAYASSQLPFRSSVNDSYELELLLLDIIQSRSVYCKYQAFNALYRLGQIDSVVKGVLLQANTKGFKLHHKLITDGLLTFEGDKEQLTLTLFNQFDQLDAAYQTSLIDYARLASQDILGENLIPILKNPETHTDVICSVLRYYQHNPTQLAFPFIIKWADESINPNWESVAVATTALSSYPSDQTTDLLLKNIISREWYVRRNAAQSIQKMDMSPEILDSILSGDDQYAKEQLIYLSQKGE